MTRTKTTVRAALGLTAFALLAASIAPGAGAATKTTKKKAVTTKKTVATTRPAVTAAPATTTGATSTVAPAAPTGSAAGAIPATNPIALDPKVVSDPNGSIRLSFIVPPVVLDPHKETNIGQRPYWVPIYDTLFDLSQPSEPRPQVALDYIVASDGLSVTMHLRTDVKFHDGVQVDASVVKANLDRARTVSGSTAAARINEITSVDAVDRFTVRVNLSRPLPGLRALLAGGAGALIHPKAMTDGRNLSLSPGDAGSGPMVATQVIPNNKVVYERASTPHWNPNWQRLKSAEIIGFADYQVAQNAIQSGQLELSYQNVEPQPLRDIAKRNANLRSYDVPTTVMRVFWVRNTRNRFADIRVRQALQMAINRESFLRASDGDCVPRTQLFPAGSPLNTPGLDPYPYDPARARALLKEAGVTNLEIDAKSTDPNSKFQGDVLEQMFADIGVKLKVGQADTSVSTQYRQGQHEAFAGTFTLTLVDPVAMIDDYFLAQPGGFQQAGAEGAALQKLRDQAVDPKLTAAQRNDVLKAMGAEVARLALILPICNNGTHFLGVSKVQNVDGLGYQWLGVPDIRGLGMAS